MSTPEQVFGRLQRLPRELERARRDALASAGDKAKAIMSSVPGAPHRVAGRPVRVVSRTKGDDLIVGWKPVGLVRIVNDNTKPHTIERRAFTGTRGRGRRAQRGAAILAAFGVDAHAYGGPLSIPGIGPRASAHHPGTHGKHFVERGKEQALPKAVATFHQKMVTEPVSRVFGG